MLYLANDLATYGLRVASTNLWGTIADWTAKKRRRKRRKTRRLEMPLRWPARHTSGLFVRVHVHRSIAICRNYSQYERTQNAFLSQTTPTALRLQTIYRAQPSHRRRKT